MRLTSTSIKSLTLPPGVVDRTFWCSDLAGFGLRLRASGKASWIAQYAVSGKTRRVTLGSPDVVSVGQARERAQRILAATKLGADPGAEKSLARARAADSVGALIPKFLERQRARLGPRSLVETTRHLAKHARPLHATPITKLTRRDVAILLSDLGATRGPSAANRVCVSLSALCTWAIRAGYIDNNPCSLVDRAVEGGPRQRLLSDAELAAIWNSLLADQYGTILKLLLLLGLRRDEIAGLRWSEVDLAAATIVLPSTRTKNKKAHVVPLSEQALALLAAQPRQSERDRVFGTQQSWHRAKLALDRRIAAREGAPLAPWVLHDFRRCASTSMHERLGVQPHIVEAVLGHTTSGHRAGVAGTYNLSTYSNECRRALQRWVDHVTAIVSGTDSASAVVHRLRA